MHFGLDPKMLPVVHKKVSSQLQNGRAYGNKYIFFCFPNKSKRRCISCHCHHYQPHLHDSPGSSLEYVRTEHFLDLRNQCSYTRVQKTQSPFPPEIFLLSLVRGTARQLIQDQQNRHKGRRLLKKMKNMQNDQKIHLQIAIHTDLALELQQPILWLALLS